MATWCKWSDQKPEWASENDEALYVLTVDDLIGVFNQDSGKVKWKDLTREQKERLKEIVRKYLDGFMGGGVYNWDDAIKDAIQDWDKERR